MRRYLTNFPWDSGGGSMDLWLRFVSYVQGADCGEVWRRGKELDVTVWMNGGNFVHSPEDNKSKVERGEGFARRNLPLFFSRSIEQKYKKDVAFNVYDMTKTHFLMPYTYVRTYFGEMDHKKKKASPLGMCECSSIIKSRGP